MPASRRLEREQHVPRPVDEVFPFFEDAHNLEAITPPFLRFRVLTPPPVTMRPGTLIDYELRLFGVPFRWRTRIEVFDRGRRFVDVQLRGPYRRWHHRHEFEPVGSGTLVIDVVDYELPLDPFGRLADGPVVRPALERIFDHRRDAIARHFGGATAVTGSSARTRRWRRRDPAPAPRTGA